MASGGFTPRTVLREAAFLGDQKDLYYQEDDEATDGQSDDGFACVGNPFSDATCRWSGRRAGDGAVDLEVWSRSRFASRGVWRRR